MIFAIAAVVFVLLWVVNSALFQVPSPVGHVLVALALASALAAALQLASKRRRPPDT